jgi:NADH-quinone oxidoreductase subunit J
MTRFLIILASVAAIATFGMSAAEAQDAPRPASGAPGACPREVESAVRTELSTSLSKTTPIVCHAAKDDTVNGEKVQTVQADVVFADGRTAALTVTTKGVPAKGAAPTAEGAAAATVAPSTEITGTDYTHTDLTGSSGKGMALLFWLFAFASIAGALFVVTRRNLIAAVMGMVGSFLGIAAIYMMLYAQFLAVVQMLVYAGAIMVLFVFVVMILNRPEDEPVAPSGRGGQAIGGLAILYLVGRLILMLMSVQPPNPAVAMAAPAAAEHCVEWQNHACIRMEPYDWGSVRSVGTDLFGPGLFPFEAISILLLIAVVGAIAVARPVHFDDDAPAKIREEGAA